MFLVVLVLDDPDRCSEVLDAWESAGVTGVTILESTGIGRLRRAGLREDLPMMPSLRDLFSSSEIRHRTIFSAVKDQEMVQALVKATQNVLGDLNQPHTGIIFVLPVLEAYGLDIAKHW